MIESKNMPVHPNIEIQIVIQSMPKDISLQLGAWAYAALKNPEKQVTLRIVDEPEIHALNKQFRHKDKATNVLSFPNAQADTHLPKTVQTKINRNLGDIILCASIIEQEALEQHKPLAAHWAHMVIHGCLHLQGYDHETEEDAKKMETEEIGILQNLGYANPYDY